jgi:hypothetical protein
VVGAIKALSEPDAPVCSEARSKLLRKAQQPQMATAEASQLASYNDSKEYRDSETGWYWSADQ